MRTFLKTLFFCCTLTSAFIIAPLAQAPTVGASNFSVSTVEGNSLRINWTRGDGGAVLVIASESPTFNGSGVPANATDYNASTEFSTGDQIGTGNFVVYRNSGSSVTVTGLEASTTYYFRLYEFNGTDFSTEYNTTAVLSGNGTTLSAPTTGTSNFTNSTTGNTAALSWTRGNGSRTLIILQEGSPTTEPTQYTNYFASSTFGNGSAIGAGRVVYFGTGTSVNVTNLQPDTEYFYRVLEANGNSGPVYNFAAALTGSFNTLGAPTSGSTNISFSSIQGNRASINFTRGDGSKRLIVARQDSPVTWVPTDGVDYNPDTNFGVGDDLGNNTFVIAKTVSSGTLITALTPATTYHIAIFEMNGEATNTFYLTSSTQVLTGQFTTLEPPTVSAGGFAFTDILGHRATVSFTAGNGDRRLVLVRSGTPVTDVPVNLVNYFASSFYTSASNLGASKIVYNGSGTSFDLRSLQPNTTYHFAIFEYNGSSGPIYKQVDPGTGSFTTQGKPTVAPTAATFTSIEGNQFRLNYTTGNGFGRIIIAKEGAPVDRFPADFTSYTANSTFGTAATALGNGNFVIANDASLSTTSSAFVRGLSIGTTYHFAVIEYNGTDAERIYMTSAAALTASNATLSAPTMQATNATFTNITANSVTINWDNGNGDQRIVLLREGTAVE